MNEDKFKEQAARIRQIASKADSFTKRRLLDLAEKYDGPKFARRPTPLRSVTLDDMNIENQSSGGDPG